MQAETLNCPMCGASVSTSNTRCDHCGARLATVACPSCFGLMFLGEKFCSHCGAKAVRPEVSATESRLCPRCKARLTTLTLGATNLHECPRCEGIWVDAAALEQICADRDQQVNVLGVVTQLPPVQTTTLETKIHYVPCPVCRQLMNRVNFANCSGVIVDVCKAHGTWFDRDELRRLVEFIRGGGLDVARAREVAELEERKRRLTAEQNARSANVSYSFDHTPASGWSACLSAAGDLLDFLRRR